MIHGSLNSDTSTNVSLRINNSYFGGIIPCLKKKLYWSRYRPGVTQRVGRGIALLLHNRGTRRGEWSASRPGRTLPPGKTRYPLYRRLGGPQSRSGRAENLVPTGISIPDRVARSQPLYRLSYRAHMSLSSIYNYTQKIQNYNKINWNKKILIMNYQRHIRTGVIVWWNLGKKFNL